MKNSSNRISALIAGIAWAAMLGACAATQPGDSPDAASLTVTSTDAAVADTATSAPAKPGTVGYDRNVWQELLAANKQIRRTVHHTDKGIEAVTESDDPAVAAKIINHATAMQARMKIGSQVRVWDPVFAELFAKHGAVKLEVTPTDKGVKITESSDDPEAVLLLRSHAMGVSAFVRGGFAMAPEKTPKFKAGEALPAPEVAIGGVPHRFVLGQPDAAQLAGLKASGVAVVLNFRPAAEHANFDEKGAAASAGVEYCNLPYAAAADLTDDLLDSARATLRTADGKGQVVALHCRSGNRVGPAWAAYRVLDMKVPMDQAIAEAKALQMRDPQLETRVREYVAKRKRS